MASKTETNWVITVKSSAGKKWVETLHRVFGIIPSDELIAFYEEYNLSKAGIELHFHEIDYLHYLAKHSGDMLLHDATEKYMKEPHVNYLLQNFSSVTSQDCHEARILFARMGLLGVCYGDRLDNPAYSIRPIEIPELRGTCR